VFSFFGATGEALWQRVTMAFRLFDLEAGNTNKNGAGEGAGLKAYSDRHAGIVHFK
jgi:hypothetical protein